MKSLWTKCEMCGRATECGILCDLCTRVFEAAKPSPEIEPDTERNRAAAEKLRKDYGQIDLRSNRMYAVAEVLPMKK